MYSIAVLHSIYLCEIINLLYDFSIFQKFSRYSLTQVTNKFIAETTGQIMKDSVILLEQIRTIDKQRLKDMIGHLDKERMRIAALFAQ